MLLKDRNEYHPMPGNGWERSIESPRWQTPKRVQREILIIICNRIGGEFDLSADAVKFCAEKYERKFRRWRRVRRNARIVRLALNGVPRNLIARDPWVRLSDAAVGRILRDAGHAIRKYKKRSKR